MTIVTVARTCLNITAAMAAAPFAQNRRLVALSRSDRNPAQPSQITLSHCPPPGFGHTLVPLSCAGRPIDGTGGVTYIMDV